MASGALIVEGHHLAKFGLYSPDLNYDNGTHNSKYKSAEYYVDGCGKGIGQLLDRLGKP